MKKVLKRTLAPALVTLAVGILLMGCPPAVPPASTVVNSYTRGPITKLGSIFVGGVEFDVAAAAITINGASATPTDLKVGSTVKVKGTTDHATGKGTAASVECTNCLVGVVDNFPGTGQFDVLGQVVTTNASTVWDAPSTMVITSTAGLALGDVLEVSGMLDGASGTFLASLVEWKGSVGTGMTYEVDGVVGTLTATGFQLRPASGQGNPIKVVLSGGTLAAGVVDGAVVEITYADANWSLSTNTLTVPATSISLKAELQPADGDYTTVDGIVSGYTAGGTSFSVEGIAVTVNAASILPTGFANGMYVEVEGTYAAATSTLNASKITTKS